MLQISTVMEPHLNGYIEDILQHLSSEINENVPHHNLNTTFILSPEDFSVLYDHERKVPKNSAGTLIFNEDHSEILLVKGHSSNKWGPPKGHREQDESNFETAIRETQEEVGYEIKLKINFLPHVIANKIKFYCLVVPKSTTFQTRDPREIADIKWFDMKTLKLLSKTHPNDFNVPLRSLFNKPTTLKTIICKISSFKSNYKKTDDGSINEQFEKIVRYLHSIKEKTPYSPVTFHYVCFYIIQKIYNNIFANADLIAFVRDHFK
jgi:bis(5'-nucleosidyl)-tetraphosphatase